MSEFRQHFGIFALGLCDLSHFQVVSCPEPYNFPICICPGSFCLLMGFANKYRASRSTPKYSVFSGLAFSLSFLFSLWPGVVVQCLHAAYFVHVWVLAMKACYMVGVR